MKSLHSSREKSANSAQLGHHWCDPDKALPSLDLGVPDFKTSVDHHQRPSWVLRALKLLRDVRCVCVTSGERGLVLRGPRFLFSALPSTRAVWLLFTSQISTKTVKGKMFFNSNHKKCFSLTIQLPIFLSALTFQNNGNNSQPPSTYHLPMLS